VGSLHFDTKNTLTIEALFRFILVLLPLLRITDALLRVEGIGVNKSNFQHIANCSPVLEYKTVKKNNLHATGGHSGTVLMQLAASNTQFLHATCDHPNTICL
jgi:hypothetical protein